MNLREHVTWNEEMARRYDPDAFITKSGFLIRWVQSLRLAATRQALAIGPKDYVLDLGCGSGNLLATLTGAKMAGIDLSDSLLAKAKERIQGRGQTILVKGAAEQLPFPERTFDKIVCSEVLEHVLDPGLVLNEIRRVAKPGAHVVITVPNETLINQTKRWVLALGLKKWISGGYAMSDNMLDGWHRSEISPQWLYQAAKTRFKILGIRRVPSRLLAYHNIFILGV